MALQLRLLVLPEPVELGRVALAGADALDPCAYMSVMWISSLWCPRYRKLCQWTGSIKNTETQHCAVFAVPGIATSTGLFIREACQH